MCGIAGIVGWPGGGEELRARVEAMNAAQWHRGPDDGGVWTDAGAGIALGHRRLSILDLTEAGRQPMWSADGNLGVVFNGEIYNYIELGAELRGYPFRTKTDTEVILAAWQRWGEDALDRFTGMFAFLLWDRRERRLYAARDRFGVKPLHYGEMGDGCVAFGSEVRAVHAAGVRREPDEVAWATYLVTGMSDYSARTFWKGVSSLPGGHLMQWKDGEIQIRRWYDLAEAAPQEFDKRPVDEVMAEYRGLLEESVRLRFRSDVPVGINLSGGLDSATLLGLVHRVQGTESDVKAFTFTTGDERYDELPWVRQMLERTKHPLVECRLTPEEVPDLAESVMRHQDAPYGGLPTLAYAKLFETARREGVIVLLDGQGMDEQWAGYDYYLDAAAGRPVGIVQGTQDRPVRPECLTPEFAALAERPEPPKPFSDGLRNAQYRDTCVTKIPRALRFNDRVSMRASTELREPFLERRLFEAAFRQPSERKICGGSGKWMLRQVAGMLLPAGIAGAPKRPLQTPQREWLRGPLRDWTETKLRALRGTPRFCWPELERQWRNYLNGESDNSSYVWQWVGAGA